MNVLLITLIAHTLNAMDINFITGFLDQINAPNKITFLHCKQRSYVVSSMKIFQKSAYQIGFGQVDKGIPNVIRDRNVIILDMQCPGFDKIFYQARDNNLFGKNNVWIFHGSPHQIDKEFFFFKYSKTYIFLSNDTLIDVFKIYKLTQFSQQFSVELIFQYKTANEEIVVVEGSVEHRLVNLQKEPIRVSYGLLYNNTLTELYRYGESRVSKYDISCKISYLLLEQICLFLNATHQPIIRNHWGVYNETTHTYTPHTMFWDLQNNFADLGGNTGSMTKQRVDHFKYMTATGKINKNKLMWFFRAPPLSYSKNVWILPFVKELWVTIFGMSVLWCIAVLVTAYFEAETLLRKVKSRGSECLVTFDLMLSTFQGSYISPTLWSAKLISLAFSATTLLLSIAYSAHFLVNLQSTSNTIHTFDDLLKSDMKLASINESYNLYYITHPSEVMEENARRQLQLRLKQAGDRFWKNTSEAFQLIYQVPLAYHVGQDGGFEEMDRTYTEDMKRSIRTVESALRISYYLCALKNSTVDDFISYGFLYLSEKGITAKIQRAVFTDPAPPHQKRNIFSSMHLKDMVFIFLILLTGMIVSLVILVIEWVVFLWF